MSGTLTIAAVVFGLVAAVASGCADAGPARAPAPAPTAPPGWVMFTSDSGPARPAPALDGPVDGPFANEPPAHPGDPFLEIILGIGSARGPLEGHDPVEPRWSEPKRLSWLKGSVQRVRRNAGRHA
jgi:hypothetical protein